MVLNVHDAHAEADDHDAHDEHTDGDHDEDHDADAHEDARFSGRYRCEGVPESLSVTLFERTRLQQINVQAVSVDGVRVATLTAAAPGTALP